MQVVEKGWKIIMALTFDVKTRYRLFSIPVPYHFLSFFKDALASMKLTAGDCTKSLTC